MYKNRLNDELYKFEEVENYDLKNDKLKVLACATHYKNIKFENENVKIFRYHKPIDFGNLIEYEMTEDEINTISLACINHVDWFIIKTVDFFDYLRLNDIQLLNMFESDDLIDRYKNNYVKLWNDRFKIEFIKILCNLRNNKKCYVLRIDGAVKLDELHFTKNEYCGLTNHGLTNDLNVCEIAAKLICSMSSDMTDDEIKGRKKFNTTHNISYCFRDLNLTRLTRINHRFKKQTQQAQLIDLIDGLSKIELIVGGKLYEINTEHVKFNSITDNSLFLANNIKTLKRLYKLNHKLWNTELTNDGLNRLWEELSDELEFA
jgi:hypothetical protein